MVASSFIFVIFVKLADNQDRHKISDQFEFQLDRISHFGVTCPWRRIKFSIDLLGNLQVQLTFQIKIYWVRCGRNSSYSFLPIVLKLFRCFLHGMKMCMWFGYNPLIIFSHFFCFVNLVLFRYEILSKCKVSGYLVGATLLAVFHRLFWNFADVFAWNEDMHVVWVQYYEYFFSLFLLCELVFVLHEMLSECIECGYLVGTTPLTAVHWLFWNFADVFCMKWRCACGFSIILWLFFLTFSALWT